VLIPRCQVDFSPAPRPERNRYAHRAQRSHAPDEAIVYNRGMAPKSSEPGEITELLRGAASDTTMAGRLWSLVYPELKRRAGYMIGGERSDHTLSATAVVSEAFLRISSRMAHEWEDRSHFYAVASGIMRHVLIDHARGKRAEKRGGVPETRNSMNRSFRQSWIVRRDFALPRERSTALHASMNVRRSLSPSRSSVA